tara:strand:+ start:415 stop:894 length:480 start_codon:yes stop_codon:yes gene_type:complete
MTPTKEELIQFVLHECRLLDDCEYEQWLDLFLEDGMYWMPLDYQTEEEKLTTSLFYEDKLLLDTRIRRYAGDRTFSQQPKSRCQHMLQTPTVDSIDEIKNEYKLYTPFQYVEYRLGETQTFSGWMRHTLSVHDDKLKIKQKRIDLINSDAAHRSIQLFI